MVELNEKLHQARALLAEFQSGFNQAIPWYKDEMDKLKQQLIIKDKEIEELKIKLNEK